MITVKVSNVSISNVGFVVFLRDEKSKRSLPIFVGVPEAQAIAIELNEVKPPRPLTHDLIKNVLDMLEGRLEYVLIHDLQDGTFYGRLVLGFEGQTLEVDSRPSDAIALALRCKAPIMVSEAVFDEAGVATDEDGEEGMATAPDETAEKDPLAVLKSELQRAVQEERYEDAARLRDNIRKTGSSN